MAKVGLKLQRKALSGMAVENVIALTQIHIYKDKVLFSSYCKINIWRSRCVLISFAMDLRIYYFARLKTKDVFEKFQSFVKL